ncbi:unnamed protein product [Calypogeia fissa]
MMAFSLPKTGPIHSQPVGAAAVAQFFGVNISSSLGRSAYFNACGTVCRPWILRNLTQFTSSSSRSACTSMQPGNLVGIADGSLSSSSEVIESPRESEVGGEVEAVSVSASSGRKSKRICYYHSQGLCTMMEDPVHLAKLTHEFQDISVREEDLKKVKEQPFDYFLVLDLEGMVEILEFPVVMVDAKTLQVVDHFHRFVRPAKMKEDWLKDYIHNKYGRWGLDRVWHDTAIPFTDMLPAFETWLESHGLWDPTSNAEKLKTAAFVTCGNWDIKTKIPEQCITSEIDLPAYFNEWINLKDIYFNFYKFRASGMLKMIKGLKMPLLGTHHVGLDDALNIARILQRMLAHGARIQLTAKRKAGDPKAVKFTFKFRIK